MASSQMDDTVKPSRALPIAVAGAIAVAVFATLFVVNAGGKGEKGSSGPTATTDKPADKPPDKPATDKPAGTVDQPTADKPADQPPTDKPVVAVADAGAPAAPKTAMLTITVKPADATITVDGKPVSGGKISLPVSDTPVKVAASAPGYTPAEKSASVTRDGSVYLELAREVAETRDPPKTPPKTPPKVPPRKKPPKVEL